MPNSHPCRQWQRDLGIWRIRVCWVSLFHIINESVCAVNGGSVGVSYTHSKRTGVLFLFCSAARRLLAKSSPVRFTTSKRCGRGCFVSYQTHHWVLRLPSLRTPGEPWLTRSHSSQSLTHKSHQNASASLLIDLLVKA